MAGIKSDGCAEALVFAGKVGGVGDRLVGGKARGAGAGSGVGSSLELRSRQANAPEGKKPQRWPAPNLDEPSTRPVNVNRYLSEIPQLARPKYDASDECGDVLHGGKRVAPALSPCTPRASVENPCDPPHTPSVLVRCSVVPPSKSRLWAPPIRRR